MWLKIGVSLGLMLSLVITTAQEIRAQELLWVPRDQLFSAVLGQEVGKTLGAAINAYALGKARKEELEAIRDQIAKCGNNCSDDLKNALKQHEHEDAVLESVIDDVAIKTGSGFGGLDWVKALLSLEPPKLTSDQRAEIDLNARINIIKSYCYTISDQLPTKQKQCEADNPLNRAKDIDRLMENMCVEKVGKEVNMNLRDQSYQLGNDKAVIRKFNHALGDASECIQSTSYFSFWRRSVYTNCNKDAKKFGLSFMNFDISEWCVPDPTDKARTYKFTSSLDVPFKLAWLTQAMYMEEPRPKVLERVYSREIDKNDTVTLDFWGPDGVPPTLRIKDHWGGAARYPLSAEGLHGEKLPYDFQDGGHYLGLESVDKCPTDLEKAIQLRQQLLSKVEPPYLAPDENPPSPDP
jgi:hypothetical protein